MCQVTYLISLTIGDRSIYEAQSNSDPQREYKPTSLHAVPGRPIGDATLLAKVVAIVPTTASLRVRHVLVMRGISKSQVPGTSGNQFHDGACAAVQCFQQHRNSLCIKIRKSQ
jgi:hypothetical protein